MATPLRPRSTLLEAGALLAVALLAAGCGAQTVEPEYEIDPQDHVVVLPFLDLGTSDRWSSSRGSDLARRTTEVLAASADFRVRPYEDVMALFRAEDLSKVGPSDAAALCRADYALVCDLERYELDDPHRVNIPRGSTRVRVRLFKVVHRTPEQARRAHEVAERQRQLRQGVVAVEDEAVGGEWVHVATAEATYPSDFTQRYDGVTMTKEQIEEGLRQATARRVAQLYFEHPREKLPRDL